MSKRFYCNCCGADWFVDDKTINTMGANLSQQVNEHKMKLKPVPFDKIKSGEKSIELRLYDKKRQQVKIGDKIAFTNIATGEVIKTFVANLHRFATFDELYGSLPLLKCGYTIENVDEAKPSDMEQYYSVDEQKRYGVVGIELCNIKEQIEETDIACPDCGALYDPDDETFVESYNVDSAQEKYFRCNACGTEFPEPMGVYEKLRCPACQALEDDGVIEEIDCSDVTPPGSAVYIELSKEFCDKDCLADAVKYLRNSGILAKKEGHMIVVSHDDSTRATEALSERGFLMHSVVCSQDDSIVDAIFEAVQSLCPFPITKNHKTIAYMVSVIANAMKSLEMSVSKDVLEYSKTICPSTEFSVECPNLDAKLSNRVQMTPRHDDDLLCEAGDLIDNAVFNAIQALSDKKIEWDMRYIGSVAEAIESAMESFGVPSCHPWQDDEENICYSLDNERCPHCQLCKKEN